MRETAIGFVTLNSPPLNILTRNVLAVVRRELAALAREPALRVVVLRAEGRHFSAGASVEEHLPPACDALIGEFGETVLALRDFPLPVIAAVRGRCLGGGFELVQAADLVLAADDAVFGQPEIGLGVLPPAACALLPALVGRPLAAELIFTGASLTAAEAQAAGIVRRVVPGAELDDAVDGLARRIARHSGAALRLAKRALGQADGAPGAQPAVGVGRAGRIYLDELMKTEDALEGLRAFLEKREPHWSDR